MRAAAIFLCLMCAGWAAEAKDPALADLAFLEGHWRGGDENFVFEETWNAIDGGVMTAMARGVGGGQLRVLEYIIVMEDEDGVVMRFKHFNADFSTWEEAPIVLRLDEVREKDLTFRNVDPQAEVQTIRYFAPSDDALQADVGLSEDGAPGGFSLSFVKVSN